MFRLTKSRCPRLFLTSALAVALLCPMTAYTQPSSTSCIDVRVGSARSLDCINRGLRARAAQVHPQADASTLTATSPSNEVGTFNQSATREYLGSSFGHSAIPQPHPQTTAPPPR